jgi:hypothetical protein
MSSETWINNHNALNFVTLSLSYVVPADLIESIPEPEATPSVENKWDERIIDLNSNLFIFIRILLPSTFMQCRLKSP